MIAMPRADLPLPPGERIVLAMEFPLHNRSTAPAQSAPALERIGQDLGYVPALLAQMAESPPMLEAYQTLSAIFRRSSLTVIEQ